jgi:hypothetical protein
MVMLEIIEFRPDEIDVIPPKSKRTRSAEDLVLLPYTFRKKMTLVKIGSFKYAIAR